jgi:predicted transcriptional regulator
MEPVPLRALALFISIFLVAVPCATAGTGGYIVTPAVDTELTGPPQDPVPISFWDLPPRQMLIALALSFCPVLVYPVEIFFYLKLLAALGYRKVEQYAVSYNKNRQKIYEYITANPGVKFHALERLTGMKEGTLKYHLLVLGMKRRIVSFGTGRSVRYFENNGRYSEFEKKVFLHLQDPTTRRIIGILATSPEVSRKDIAETVGITGPSISWHTKRLSGDGIITTEKNGRAVRYTLCPAGANIFRQYFAQDAVGTPGDAPTGEEPDGPGLDKSRKE